MIENVEEIFVKSGAVMKGHFLLTSGRHSPVYWEKFQVLQYPRYTEQLCRMIAEYFRDRHVQVVAGPTTGGVILAYEVGKQLDVRSIFAEKEAEKRVFRRGFTLNPGERVLIVDDILTTGKSIHEVADAVTALGGHIVGIGVLVNRAEHELKLEGPLFACHRAPTVSYAPEECPLCAARVPLVKPGGG